MKIQSVQTLDVIDLNEEGAKKLIAAGIYVPVVDEKQPEEKSDEQPTGRKSRR